MCRGMKNVKTGVQKFFLFLIKDEDCIDIFSLKCFFRIFKTRTSEFFSFFTLHLGHICCLFNEDHIMQTTFLCCFTLDVVQNLGNTAFADFKLHVVQILGYFLLILHCMWFRFCKKSCIG